MADKKISALTGATTPLAGTEVLPIVQSGSTVKVAVSDLTAGRAVTVLSEIVTDGTRKLYLRARSSAAGTGLAVGTEVTSAGNVVTLAGDIDGGGTGGGVNLAYYSGTSGNWNAAVNIRNTAGTYSTLNLMQEGGDVSVGGNLVIGTSGKGIDFSATSSGSGTMTSELLADYEEGTFTPTLTCGTSGTITLNGSQNTLTYTKVGRVVTVTGYISVSAISSPLGRLTLNGLPFTCANGLQFQAAMTVYAASMVATAITAIQGRVTNNATTATIDNFATGDSTFDLSNKVQVGTNFAFSFSYFAA